MPTIAITTNSNIKLTTYIHARTIIANRSKREVTGYYASILIPDKCNRV